MIVDLLERADRYAAVGPRIRAAIDWLRAHDLEALPVGKVEIDGDRLFAVVQSYTTKPQHEGFWEAHRRYIDVQYVVRGHELFGWAPLERLSVTHPYDDALEMLKAAGPGDFVRAAAGTMLVVWPEDAHMPGIQDGGPAEVRKIVLKMAVAG